jgi:hypothetical protein
VHVERQQNGDEELFRPPLLVNDLAGGEAGDEWSTSLGTPYPITLTLCWLEEP